LGGENAVTLKEAVKYILFRWINNQGKTKFKPLLQDAPLDGFISLAKEKESRNSDDTYCFNMLISLFIKGLYKLY